MATESPNSFQQKTDDELLFFVRNPSYYHSELVELAVRELRRRGVPLAVAPPQGAYVPPPEAPESRFSAGLIITILAGLGLLGGGVYYYNQQMTPPVAKAKRVRKNIVLTEVPIAAIPNYDAATARSVEAQLARVPAVERANDKNLTQYRVLTRRFWAAETQTEYLTNQAVAGTANPEIFSGQVLVVHDTWQQWNKAMRYSFHLGPVMTEHLTRMSQVARQQQESLADMPASVEAHVPLNTRDFQRRAEDVDDLLRGLLPVSPVSGKPYRQLTRTIKM